MVISERESCMHIMHVAEVYPSALRTLRMALQIQSVIDDYDEHV